MSDVNAGSARAVYTLSIDQARAAANELRGIFAGLKQAGTGLGIGAGDAKARAAAIAQQRLATEQQKTAQTAARASVEQQRLATEEQRTAAATARAEQAQLRLAQAHERAAKGSGLASQFADGIKSGLLGIIGPAALAAGAFAAVRGAVDSFRQAFTFKATLDQSRTAITAQLNGVRDTGQAFQQAAAFGVKYKLTQEEVTAALQASVGVLRQSKSSVDDVLTTLLRLQQLSPEQGLAGASLALKELASGDIQSLVERFEVSRAAANKMKAEIQGGADAVQVLSKFLGEAGIGAEALEARTKGAAGALNDLKTAQEDLVLAQAQFAQGPGLAILQERILLTRGLTNTLSGQVVITDESKAAFDRYSAIIAATSGNLVPLIELERQRADALRGIGTSSGGTFGPVEQLSAVTERLARGEADQRREAIESGEAIRRYAIEVGTASAKTELAAVKQELMAARTREVADGFLAANPQIDAAGIRAAILAGALPAVAGQLAIVNLQIRNTRAELAALTGAGSVTEGRAERDTPSQLAQARTAGAALGREQAKERADKAADAQKARSAQIAALGTDKARLAELQKQLDVARRLHGANSADAIEAETRLGQEKQRQAKTDEKAGTARIAAGTKALNLEENIRDSKEKQYAAALAFQRGEIEDRQKRRTEDREIAAANRILGSGRSSQLFKDAAADRIALINVERQQRALAIQEQQKTAGGTIINGKVFQSKPGTGGTVGAPAGAPGAFPGGLPTSGPGQGPAAGNVVTFRLVDTAGRLIAEAVAPFIFGDARAALAHVNAGGA